MASDEVYVGPADVYLAPVGEAFPAVNAAPAGNWVLHGTQGSKNYTEEGVTVRRNVENTMINALGTVLPRKAAITSAGFEVEYEIMDLSPENLALAFGADPDDIDTVVQSAGVAGNESFVVPTNPKPIERAVLVRIPGSPSGVGNSQFEIASAVQLGGAEGTFSKDAAYGAGNLWAAIEPDTGDAIRFRVQTTAPGTP